jgi:hypothetical protein
MVHRYSDRDDGNLSRTGNSRGDYPGSKPAAVFHAIASEGCAPERFPAKWIPVRVKKTRQNKSLEPRSDSIGTEKALSLSVSAQDKCSNRERDGEHRSNHPRENIESGLSAHDAPRCIAEQRLLSPETLCARRDFVSARIDARLFDAPYEVCAWPGAAAA